MAAPRRPPAEPRAPRGTDATFVVDASVWISLWEEHYPPDLFPTLWRQLQRHCTTGRVRVPREVMAEVGEQRSVMQWLRAINPTVVVNPTPPVIAIARVLREQYPELTAGEAAGASADPWLVALAEHHEWWVATEEKPGSNASRMKIPDVCAARDVEFIRTLPMLKALGIRVCAGAACV